MPSAAFYVPSSHDAAPLADYAMIGDSRSAALIARSGSIDWLCWPRVDSPSVFARLLDPDAGYFSIAPSAASSTTRRYLDGTPVLLTRFTTPDGVVELCDAMPALTEVQKQTWPLPFRSLIRRVEAIQGRVELRVTFCPRPDYGRVTPRLQHRGAHHVAAVWGQELLNLRSDVRLEVEDDRVQAVFTVDAGEVHYFALGYSQDAPAVYPNIGVEAEQELAWTQEYWRKWLGGSSYHGPHAEAVTRSALVLKLLAYAPSGAIVAAPTTSLPEVIGGDRNWDYRYCWLRDAAYSAKVLYQLGYRAEADSFVQWLLHATRLTHPELRVLYSVYGEPKMPERELHHLRGYQDSRPVRVGNGAHGQFQLDVYGYVLEAFGCFVDEGGRLDADSRRLVTGAADFVARKWQEPDAGIWEMRGAPAHYVHGKAMAWLALQQACHLADKAGVKGPTERWRDASERIQRAVMERGFDDQRQSFTAAFGHGRLDGSLLTLAGIGFIQGSDPRMTGTIRAIRRELAHEELVYRYDERADGRPVQDGAFVACCFWLVDALARSGQVSEAHRLFERLLSRANDLGLLPEEIDVQSGAMLGNFPQALSHIALIEAALSLEAAS